MDLHLLTDLDKHLLLTLNGSESLYLDSLMRTLTNAWTWVPLYLSLFYLVLKNNDSVKKILMVLASAGLCVVLAGTIDDTLVKPIVARWRPTHDPEIGLLVDIVDGYRGGSYGFFSAHASNTFSIAVFFCWLVRSRLLSIALVAWSLLNCWTRVYLGVHFPGDILVGLLWGALCGSVVYYCYRRLSEPQTTQRGFVSTQYTLTGYQRSDADVPVSVLMLTLVYAIIKSCIV